MGPLETDCTRTLQTTSNIQCRSALARKSRFNHTQFTGPCVVHSTRGRVWFTVHGAVCGSQYTGPCVVHSTRGRVWFTVHGAVCGSQYTGPCVVVSRLT